SVGQATGLDRLGLEGLPRGDVAHAGQAEDRVTVVLDQPLAALVVFLHRSSLRPRRSTGPRRRSGDALRSNRQDGRLAIRLSLAARSRSRFCNETRGLHLIPQLVFPRATETRYITRVMPARTEPSADATVRGP